MPRCQVGSRSYRTVSVARCRTDGSSIFRIANWDSGHRRPATGDCVAKNMPLLDEETRNVVLKKTWCHGQLVLPAFALLHLCIFFGGVGQHQFNVSFLYAAIVFPLWSYHSYETISGARSYALRPLLVGGLGAQIAHFGILVSVAKASTALDMLLLIASSLFLVETAAFLCVAWKLRPPSGRDEIGEGSGVLQTRDRFSDERG